MPDVAIRKMCEDDRLPVMRLLSRWNMAPLAPSPDVPDPERSTLLVENTFVANADGILIGVASYILHGDGSAETASLAVDPAWLGSHVGANLQKARLMEMKARGIERVRTEADRPGVVDWYVRKFRYRIVGTARKKHPFGLASVDHWTVLELDLRAWQPRRTQDREADTDIRPTN